MVEGKRTYQSKIRAQQAERTRNAVIAAAAECFTRLGYAETTMKAIAAHAGVSAQTVFAHGGKAALLLAAVDRSIAGGGDDVPLLTQDRFQQMLNARDKDEKLRLLRGITLDWLPAAGPILRSFREAAPGDPEIAAAWEEYERRRHRDAGAIIESCSHLLRPGLTVERATDIYWAALGPQVADAFLLGRGWALTDYADWLMDAMDRLLFR
ncbi:helix-turn-helix domain-containing protein [Dactylosporangium sp. NPDC000244]|uniref:TetR/AcrR family transcriptional regulator n=1 Tax=Dactylosporangium sp. NPDC000244 TaxID=3154365 RepID=UPI003326DF70